MKTTFLILLFVVVFLLLLCGMRMNKLRYDFTNKAFCQLIYITGSVISLYAVAIIVNDQKHAFVLYSFYYIFLDLMLLHMLHFIRLYVQYKSKSKHVDIFLCVLFVADAFSFISNIFYHWFFRVSAVLDVDHTIFYRVTVRKLPFYFHLAYVYIIIIMIVILLVNKSIKISKVYKDKYVAILVIFIITTLLNILYNCFGRMYDYSIVSYGIALITIYYYIYFFKPYRLVNNLFRFVIHRSDYAILCFDSNHRCIHANEYARKLFSRIKHLDVFTDYYLDIIKEKNLRNVHEKIWNEVLPFENKRVYFEVKYQRLRDSSGKLIGSCLMYYNKSDEMALMNKHSYLAKHDVLTGIYNRECFFDVVQRFLETVDEQYCMVCTDVRNFKIINDIYGEEKGNEILIKVADMIKKTLAGKEFCCRLQDDRFAICMPKSRFQEKDFISKIRNTSKLIGASISINMYVGVYDIVDTSMNVATMCDRAIFAIQSVKNNYEGVISYYDEHMHKREMKDQMMVDSFVDAIDTDQFQIFLQPQVDTKENVHGAEVLSRWIHPDYGMIPTMDFIEVFERTNLISKFDMHIWEKACKVLSRWKKTGRENYSLSVNISTKDFYYLDIYEVFTGLVEKYDISPDRLHLEITETAVMDDMEMQGKLIKRLREYGFSVEMDDFGSGYSSLNMLSELNVNTLKIDMGFLRNSEFSEKSQAIIQSIIELSKELGMIVVSEGVETKEQNDILVGMGTDIIQGYYFAKPMRVSDFEEAYFS